MDIFSLLSYINKVSLLAFFVTTLVVGYQIYVLKKEKIKEKNPVIPDFQEKNNFNTVANFTNLPSSLTKKETKVVNYLSPVFLIISLLTVIVIVFVVTLIKKNGDTHNQVLVNPPLITTTVIPTIIPTVIPNVISTVIPTVEPVISPTKSIEPTEIILAKAPTLTQVISPTNTIDKPQVLPETGSWEKGFLMIGVAISTVFFSFWF